jgi:cupin 2 domain-containing protein
LAGLRLEGEGERNLRPGDHVLIPALRAHWVTYTANEPTIWLAIHFG